MTPDVLTAISARLTHAIGLDVESIGRRAVESAIRARMAATRSPNEGQYLMVLARPEELTALIEEIVVPETWFLRDRVPFTNLAAHATATRSARGGEPFRALSVPCSTGEEPYSIAIALYDGGMVRREIEIDAMDISHRAVAFARLGLYGPSSFRGDDLKFRDRHFHRVGAGWQVSDDVMAPVTFTQGNLLDAGCIPDGRRYHAVFCRNLLIYLSASARAAAISRLEAALEPGGLFVVGHAEALQVMDPRFQALDRSGAFTYMRARELPRQAVQAAQSQLRASGATAAVDRRATTQRLRALERPRAAPAPASAPAPQPATPPSRDLLGEAAALADRGELAAAADLCAQYFRVIGPDAPGYALLGTIRQAAGQLDDAEAMFSRALYCDPAHYESLVHLALLRERRGDRAGAENLRRRAAKAHASRGSR